MMTINRVSQGVAAKVIGVRSGLAASEQPRTAERVRKKAARKVGHGGYS